MQQHPFTPCQPVIHSSESARPLSHSEGTLLRPADCTSQMAMPSGQRVRWAPKYLVFIPATTHQPLCVYRDLPFMRIHIVNCRMQKCCRGSVHCVGADKILRSAHPHTFFLKLLLYPSHAVGIMPQICFRLW